MTSKGPIRLRTVAAALTGAVLALGVGAAPALAADPPNVYVTFGDSSVPLGGQTSMTLAIVNPNFGTGLTSVGFTDSLTAGLAVASPNHLSNDCGGTASAAGSTISLSGGAISAGNSCSVSAEVEGTQRGDLQNPVNINSSAGTGPEGDGSLRVGAPEGGAKLVKDILPGSNGSGPGNFASLGKTALFSASDSSGRELWRSDGTKSGTKLVKDINPAAGSGPFQLTRMGNAVYFNATDGTNDFELFRTDGTGPGTKLVKDINPSGASNPNDFAVLGKTLYFAANDGTNGIELWRSNGKGSGTKLVKDINPSGDSNPYHLLVVHGKLFFEADDGTHGTELWSSNGKSGGTKLVKDINPGSGSSSSDLVLGAVGPVVLGKNLLFRADDGTHGIELWRSDGTAAGTKLVKDISAGPATSSPADLVQAGGKALFAAEGDSGGRELWRTDGTAAGTKLVEDIAPSGNSNPLYLTTLGKQVLFQADDGSHGRELWRSNGTAAGTKLVTDPTGDLNSSAPANLVRLGKAVYYVAQANNFGHELWRSDGTAAGTHMVEDISPLGGSGPYQMTPVGNRLFLSADDTVHGAELWALTPCATTHPSGACGVPPLLGLGLSGTTIAPHGGVSAKASIGGLDTKPAGTMGYRIYSDDHCGHLYANATPPNDAVKKGKAPRSKTVSFTKAGTYWWVASYSGDPKTYAHSASTDCGAAPLVVRHLWKDGDVTTHDQLGWVDTPGTTTLGDHFSAIYTTGAVEIGDTNTAYFTTASAVLNFLPATGPPSALTVNLVNPTSSPAGAFGGDVLALELNVDYADNGFLAASSGVKFGDLKLCNLTSLDGEDVFAANGMSVRDVLAAANTSVGGDAAFMPLQNLYALTHRLTQAFEDGSPNTFAQASLFKGSCP